MSHIVIDDLDAAIKSLIELADDDPDALAVQIADYPEFTTPHYLFSQLFMDGETYPSMTDCRDDDGLAIRRIVTEYRLYVQVDRYYCRNGGHKLVCLVAALESGLLPMADNFVYTSSGNIKRMPFTRHAARYFRHTVDLYFSFKTAKEMPINEINRVDIMSCPALPTQPITVTRD